MNFVIKKYFLQVLDLVEQTGSSLQRFKKKLQKVELFDVPESKTDEVKILAQVSYDVSFVIQRAVKCNIDLSRLKLVESRASKIQIN